MSPRVPGVSWLTPDWPAPASVRALSTLRAGGVSRGVYEGLNLGDHVGDQPADVSANRAALRRAAALPGEPRWLRQVHGVRAVAAEGWRPGVEADACHAASPGLICAVLTADCLPVLLADTRARAVAVAHAGWRGLAAGVVERSVDALREQAGRDAEVIAWLGPAIGPRAFEVGDDVVHAFCDQDRAAAAAFVRGPREGKWLADLYRLARIRLARVGVSRVSGGEHCTVHERERFYSHRRDRVSGRMASLIWLDSR